VCLQVVPPGGLVSRASSLDKGTSADTMRIIYGWQEALTEAGGLERAGMTGLPDYHYVKPPVIEVAIGVQFAPLMEFSVGHVGMYWATIRETFNRVEEQAPIAHILEPPHGPSEPVPAWQFMDKPELPRVWFLDATGCRIIQVQRDRFLHNWRKVNPSDEYPRFPSVREGFLRYWGGFNAFLAENNLKPQPDQCELTYVNHIKKGDGWNTIAELEKVFPTFAWKTRSGFLPEPDSARWSLRFLLPESTGRLHVDVVPVRVPPQNDPVVRYSLTARGRPRGEFSTKGMNEWFAIAHEWIVRAFADLVDKNTDAIWEKTV